MLFKSPKGNNEQELALNREMLFQEQYGDLAAAWNQRLISSGMPAHEVASEHGMRTLPPSYSIEQELQFANYAQWGHRATADRFEIGKGTATRNRQLWALFAKGLTENELAECFDVRRQTLNRVLRILKERCHEDIRSGLTAPEKDSRAEVNEWIRLQAIKQKHIKMLREGRLGETIVDSIIDSGCLEKLPIDSDVVDALNHATAQIALALEVEHV